MSDDRITAVLRRAAEDRAFRDALMAKREETLDMLETPGLTPAEKAVLMAPTRKQLEKMIEQARKGPWYGVGRGIGGMLLKGGAVAAVVLGIGAISIGSTREASYEACARSALRQIAEAESVYKREHGTYVGIEDLVNARMIEMRGDMPYEFEISLDGDTFTATARHRTRPDTRRAFQVGPGGEVKPVERGADE